MAAEHRRWYPYQELRPDELAAIVAESPVAYWPLGLIEHHGWHLPIGFDGIKAERLCARIAERTGGVLLPVMWWGALGGHGEFRWTHYQPAEAAGAIVANTVAQLIAYGFRAIVLLCGHYPWENIVATPLSALRAAHPEVLLLWGTEANIGRPEVDLPGDHAAREETTYGLALLPELVDLDALKPGRDAASAWPHGHAPRDQYPGVRYDPADPLFAQMGADAREGSAAVGEERLTRLAAHLAARINRHLGKPA